MENQTLEKMLTSKTLDISQTFNKEFVYSDCYGKGTTITCSDSDFAFKGPVQSLRLRYRSKFVYNGLYAVIQTAGQKRDKNCEFVAILPLDDFLAYFSTPKELEEILTRGGKELIDSWVEKNGGPLRAGNRRPNSLTYDLITREWQEGKRKEKSVYTLQISTFGFTLKHQEDPNPTLNLQDLKLMIKLKSTTNVGGPETDSATPVYDGFGYMCSLSHFLGLLRSEEFSSFVDEVKRCLAESRGE